MLLAIPFDVSLLHQLQIQGIQIFLCLKWKIKWKSCYYTSLSREAHFTTQYEGDV